MYSQYVFAVSALASAASALTNLADVTFSVHSTNPLYDNQVLKLRHNQYYNSGDKFHFVGVDAISPILHANLDGGALKSISTVTYGHQGYLNVLHQFPKGNTTQYDFTFGEVATYPNAVDTKWSVQPFDGEHLILTHDVPKGTVSGFQLCEADFDLDEGSWYDLTFVTYELEGQKIDNCEPVEIRAHN